MTADEIKRALRCGRPGCSCAREGGNSHCPAHEDENPSLSVTERDGRVLLKCHAGCTRERVIDALRARGLWSEREERAGLTLEELAAVKRLPEAFLRGLGLRTVRLGEHCAVAIPYYDANGDEATLRYRLALTGDRFRWKNGAHVMPYGLWRLREIRAQGWLLLVEGESDCWTAWHHGLPALGLPGKSTWREEWARYLDRLTVFLWCEPDAQDLVLRAAQDLPELRVIRAPDGVKDLSEAHLRGDDVRALVEHLRSNAANAAELAREQQDAELVRLKQQAAPVLESDDPLNLVDDAIARLGYGGDRRPVKTVYLATTTRLLAVRTGAMPAHLLAVGPSGAGKSFTIQTALRLLPPEAYHEIEAGSPRVLIYENVNLRHHVVVFSEIDSLPRGEDNPAASAVRHLLQEHRLRYKVTVRDPESGDYIVREVVREGPTVLVSSAVRGVGGQLGTRLFTLPVPEDAERFRTILQKQGSLEAGEEAAEGIGPLVAFQSYLQRLAPWDVLVPFAPSLAKLVGQGPIAPRVTRDFHRLLALVKAVAILRHRHRRRDKRGRLMAELEDYAAVFDLVGPMYQATVTGASEAIRQVVEAVREARTEGVERVTYSAIARRVGLHHEQVRRAAEHAIRQGWLRNKAVERKGGWADLDSGDPVPDRVGLPSPEEIRTAFEETTRGSQCAVVQFSENPDQNRTEAACPNRTPAQDAVQACDLGVRSDVNCDAPAGETAQPHRDFLLDDTHHRANDPAVQTSAGPEGASSFQADLSTPRPTPAPPDPNHDEVVYDGCPLPPAACWACGGRRWWRLANPPGPWRCCRCHPSRARARLVWHGNRMDSDNESDGLATPADRQVVVLRHRSQRVGSVRWRWAIYRCACGWTGHEPQVTHTVLGNLCPHCGAPAKPS